MNIVFLLICTLDPMLGGAERVTKTLGDFFVSSGLNVYYLSVRKTSDVAYSGQHYLPNDAAWNAPENAEFYHDFLEKNDIDIVIIEHGNESDILRFACCSPRRIRLFATIHNSVFGVHSSFGCLRRYRYTKQLSFTKTCTRLALFYNKFRRRPHYKRLTVVCEKVILLSESFIPELRYFTPFAVDKVIAIPNPFAQILPLESEKIREIIYVGRIATFQKRIDLLLAIWGKAMEQLPGWKLTIVGGGEELDSFKAVADKHHLRNISFEGFQDPLPYYRRASILCLTSSYEGFPMVLVEAMQHGVVPIAFESFASIRDIIEEDIDGVLVKPFELEQYARKLVALANDPERLNKISQSGIAKSKAFSVDRIGEKWLTLFNADHSGSSVSG